MTLKPLQRLIANKFGDNISTYSRIETFQLGAQHSNAVVRNLILAVLLV
jgi:hypothetical protein